MKPKLFSKIGRLIKLIKVNLLPVFGARHPKKKQNINKEKIVLREWCGSKSSKFVISHQVLPIRAFHTSFRHQFFTTILKGFVFIHHLPWGASLSAFSLPSYRFLNFIFGILIIVFNLLQPRSSSPRKHRAKTELWTTGRRRLKYISGPSLSFSIAAI